MSVKGIGFVDSLNESSSEIDPALLGELSNAGVSAVVMPERVNVIDCTADAGA